MRWTWDPRGAQTCFQSEVQGHNDLCSRSISIGKTLFEKDLQTTWKMLASRPSCVGQKVTFSDRPRRRSFGSTRIEHTVIFSSNAPSNVEKLVSPRLHAGRLRFFKETWSLIISDPWISDTICCYKILFDGYPNKNYSSSITTVGGGKCGN